MTTLIYDLSVLRHPPAGTARYAAELLAAMADLRGDDTIKPTRGWPRAPKVGRPTRYANLLLEVGWLTIGSAGVAARRRGRVWYSPANTLPLALPLPKLVTIHDVNFLAEGAAYDRRYRLWATHMFSAAARRADTILTDSEYSRARIAEAFDVDPARIVVAYPGIDHALRVEPAAPDPDIPPRYALFVGQTEPHKNVELLLRAWKLGVPRDLELVIAGTPGRADDDLRRLAAASPARGRIRFLGRVSEARLARLQADATCFLFPSRTEGFGLPPLEAMARGTPTAVARTACLPEVTGDGAIHFDPDDPEALAALVVALADDEDLRGRLRAAGREIAARYLWAETAGHVWTAVRRLAR